MNIGISTSVIGRGKTGIGQYLFALIRELRMYAAEHRFTLFVLEEDLPLFDFAREFMRLEPVSEKFRPPLRDIWWHQTQLPKRARALKLDVLHVPSYRRMLWTSPCPRVATIHDLAPCRLAKKYEWKRMFYGRFVAPILARRQEQIIAVSRTTASDIETFFKIPHSKINVIPNGLDHERFSPGPAQSPIPRPFFLYVARLEHPGKNHWRLIEAFNRFKTETQSPWKLALAGSDWQGAEVIHEAVRLSPFTQDIHCLGFVSDAALPDLYRSASVFIYPSLYEGFGMPPLEAMACGCPAIASAAGALAEVLGGAAEIIEPESIESMAGAMKELVCNAEKRARLRKLGLRRARQFDWQHTAAATMRVYEQAILS